MTGLGEYGILHLQRYRVGVQTMILFDLKCQNSHVFEAWFQNSDSYASQSERGLISCPMCGDASVKKAPMAPRLVGKSRIRNMLSELGGKPKETPVAEVSGGVPAEVTEALKRLR